MSQLLEKQLDFGNFKLRNGCVDDLHISLWGDCHFDSNIEPESYGEFLNWYSLTNRENGENTVISWDGNHYVIRSNNKEVLKQSYDYFQHAYQKAVDINPRAPLFYHAYSGNLDQVKKLYQKGRNTWMLIYMTSKGGQKHVLKHILNHYADFKGLSKGLAEGLIVACQNGDFEIAQVILSNVAVVRKKQLRKSLTLALSEASARGSVELVELLLKNDAKVTANLHEYYETALHAAARNGHLEIFQRLLETGCTIDPWNEHLSTPLDVASECEQEKMVQYILKNTPH